MKMRSDDYTQFPKSKPWGYYPPAVEERIGQYENTIREMNDKYLEERQKSLALMQKIEHLQDELREMHLQMHSLELPEASEAVEHFVLDDFKNYNSGKFDDVPEPTIVNDNPADIKNEYNESITNAYNNEDEDQSDLPFIIVK